MAQSLSRVYLHAIFSTKNRKALIDSSIEKELYSYMSKIFRECDSPSLIINGTEDHAHILFMLSRKTPICVVIENVKKGSSKWIKTKGPEYRNFYWQNGYGVFSIGQSNIGALKEYISKQKIHHQKKSFRDEYLQFLKKYNIDYDERYVLD